MTGSSSASPSTSTVGGGVLDDFLEVVFTFLWVLRLELAVTLGPVAVWGVLVWQVWPVSTHGHLAAIVVGLVGVAVWCVPVTRRGLVAALTRARWRRRLDRVLGALDVPNLRDRHLRVRAVTRTPAGVAVRVMVPAGASWEDLDRNTERIATALRLHAASVRRERGNAAAVTLRLHKVDPLCQAAPIRSPLVGADWSDVWSPVPVGVDEDGHPVALALAYNHVLIGGLPGAGKSVAVSCLLAAAALDASVRLHLFDGKVVELAAWAPLADTNVGADPARAVEALEGLRTLMEARYADLLAAGVRKIDPDLCARFGWDVHLVVVDELAMYLTCGDKTLEAKFANLLRDLVARGRAAGVIVAAATQKPDSTVVPTSLRDLFTVKWALRCATPQASDTILGQGWASTGADAATIDPGAHGVGFLLHDGDTPTRLLGFHLDDAQIAAIVDRARRLRGL